MKHPVGPGPAPGFDVTRHGHDSDIARPGPDPDITRPGHDRVAGMRVGYDRAPLSEATLADSWLAQFRQWFDEAVAWGVAGGAGLPEPNAMVLATATPDGAPSARTVLLKDVDERGLTFFTHYTSRKGRELAANPRATLLFPWYPLQRQVIVEGTVEPISPAESDAYWRIRPWGSRIGALASPQSQVVTDRAALETAWARAAAQYPETAHRPDEAARRADVARSDQPVPRPDTWGGYRLHPTTVEFWQGRADRLHDRLRFRHDAGHWLVERLGP